MASNLMMAIWQSSDSMGGNSHLLMVLLILITFVIVVQAVVIISATLGARKTQQKLMEVAEELRTSALPFLSEARNVFAKSSELIDDVGPAVRKISLNAELASSNIVAASETLKNKVRELDDLATEVQGRTRNQVRRVDSMVTGTLDAAGQIGSSIHRSIMIPVREIAAVVNGLKAGIDSLVGRAKSFSGYPVGKTPSRDDSEMGL